MEIKRSGSQASVRGPEDWFTRYRTHRSAVRRGRTVARLGHTHPLGQRLIVTDGCGWVKCQEGPKREIRAGDVVVCPPGEKHWHGATATTAMSHIAIQEALDGKVVDWMEHVTDDEYLAAGSGAHPENG